MGEPMYLPKTPVGWIGMSVLAGLLFWVGISDNSFVSLYGYLIIIYGILVFALIGIAAALLNLDRSKRQAAVEQMRRNLSQKGVITGVLLRGVSVVLWPIAFAVDIITIAWKSGSFSFRGRASRKMYWRTIFLYFAWAFTTMMIEVFILALIQRDTNESVPPFAYYTTLIIAVGPIVASAPAIGVRRLHDINKSGWWLLLFYLIPAAFTAIEKWTAMPQTARAFLLFFLVLPVTIWAFIDLGCRRGTLGPNKYGLDPSAKPSRPPPLTPLREPGTTC
jgi:uncharacterized membrane protein YhaH (DUF805 family)